MSKKLSKFSKTEPTPEPPARYEFAPVEEDTRAQDYVTTALEKIRTIAADASAEISARVAAVEVLLARGEEPHLLAGFLLECLKRKAMNGAEIQVRAAKTLLEIAEKK